MEKIQITTQGAGYLYVSLNVRRGFLSIYLFIYLSYSLNILDPTVIVYNMETWYLDSACKMQHQSLLTIVGLTTGSRVVRKCYCKLKIALCSTSAGMCVELCLT